MNPPDFTYISQCSSEVSHASALMMAVISTRQNCRPSGVVQCSRSQVSAVIRSSSAAFGVCQGASRSTVPASSSISACTVPTSSSTSPVRPNVASAKRTCRPSSAEDPGAVVVGREQPDPELLGQRPHAQLAGADPLAAELHDRAVGERVVQHPAADAVAGLEHDHAATRRRQVAGGGQPRQAGSDDDHIRLVHLVPPGIGARRARRGRV